MMTIKIIFKDDSITTRINGTLEKVKNELYRWKNEVDFDNSKMLEVENAFLTALSF